MRVNELRHARPLQEITSYIINDNKTIITSRLLTFQLGFQSDSRHCNSLLLSKTDWFVKL